MSELGQNEGQGQDEKTPFFDSAKISEKKDVEHFSNVEGAAERAKAAERAQKAAEKEAAEVHAADVRAASEQMKQAEKEKSGKKGGILGFLFGGWHKIVAILVVLALIGGGVFLILHFSKSETYSEKVDKENKAYTEAVHAYDEIILPYNLGPSPETYDEAKKGFESAIEGADNNESVFLKIMYSCFLYENTNNFDESISILDGVREGIETEVGANYYNYRVGGMYEKAGASDKFQEIKVEGKTDEK